MHRSRYRADIDGLRAIAVLPVVLFHAGVSLFSGGYVGVDVFFVISGYLITGIIYGEMLDGRFSIAGFYERRIRRIMPALIFLLVCVIIASVLIDLPSELRRLPVNVIAAVLFFSNIALWRQSGYFSPAAEENPLTHTWSLGVEEQFYLGIPVLLFIVLRYAPNQVRSIIAACAAASLALCVFLTPVMSAASFFLTPTRAWELFAGSLLALGLAPQLQSRIAREAVAWGGIAAIGVAVFTFSPETTFPGYAAMLPVAGAMAVLLAAPRTTVGHFLSLAPFTAIGLISYSLYLWHWPLIVFGRKLGLIDGSTISIVGTVALAIVISALSWRFVERPFRTKRIEARRIFLYAGASGLLVVGVSASLHLSDGWPGRFAPDVLAFEAGTQDASPMREACHRDGGLPEVAASCVFGNGKPTAAVWGDSQGVELSAALGAQRPLMSITYSACPPALGFHSKTRPDCEEHNRRVSEYLLRSENIETVYLVAYYNLYQDKDSFFQGFERSVRLLREAGRKVVVIGPFPFPDFNVPLELARGRSASFDRNIYEAEAGPTLQFMKRLERSGVNLVWPENYFCNEDICRLAQGRKAYYFDDHHPSMTGARFFVSSGADTLIR